MCVHDNNCAFASNAIVNSFETENWKLCCTYSAETSVNDLTVGHLTRFVCNCASSIHSVCYHVALVTSLAKVDVEMRSVLI